MLPLPQPLLARQALRGPRSQGPEGKCGAKKMVLGRSFLVEEDQVRQYLSKLDINKSMGLDEMHPWVLRELANFIAKPLSIIFD